jgi:hypothetical protein
MAGEGTLISDEMFELMELVRDSDSVELKLTIPESEQRATIAALELDPLEAQIRQVYFFDTPELTLNEAGVVVRARRIQGKGDDSVVKLRPVVPSEMPAELRTSPSFGVEVDAMPGGFVCSASMKSKVTPEPVWSVAHGAAPIRKLFTKDQRAFYTEHAPAGLELDALSLLGPIFVLKAVLSPADYPRGRFVTELWLYPDGSRILELSTKCAPADLAATVLDARAFLRGRGISTGGDQHTKTKTALEFFSGELRKSSAS